MNYELGIMSRVMRCGMRWLEGPARRQLEVINQESVLKFTI